MALEIPQERQIIDSKEFRSFSEDIDYLAEFFNSLSDLIYMNGHTVSFFSGTKIYELNTSLIESSGQTLKSIKLCCSIGSFSDANSLIRKLRDDLIQYAYILSIINSRDAFSEIPIEKLDTVSFEDISFNCTLTENEQAVTAWFSNKIVDLPWGIKKKLEFKNYMTVLKENRHIHHIISHYGLDDYWGELTKKLNDYVHNNGSFYARHNLVSANDRNLNIHLKNINTRTSYTASFFLVLILMIESSLVSSSDYIDHLDFDMEPPTDSQYWIANFVQEFIDKKISTLHPELKQYLKDNNIRGMKIE